MNGMVNGNHHPDGLSEIMRNNGLELYGARLMNFPDKEDPVTRVINIRTYKVREDDVYILTFPKSGTHWTWEVTRMLVKQTTKYETRTRDHVAVEYCKMSELDAEPSPRVLNSHLWMVHLPHEIVAKRAKIIHVVRNPKDVLVSFYHHGKQMPGAGFTLDMFLKAYIANKSMSISHQFDYLRQMSEFQRAHPDHPVKLVYYEDMKRIFCWPFQAVDPLRITKELAEFLQVPATESFCEEVVSACQFEKMKTMDKGRKYSDIVIQGHMRHAEILQIYRKGTVGDWKNHLTVAQNEMFDDFISRETVKGLDYTFIYE